MTVAPGQGLAHYEILTPLGAGGMGEVWRARDTQLGREVAIKVLPRELAADAERLGRFRREARTLGSLSHRGPEQLTFPPTGATDTSASYAFDGRRIVFLRISLGTGPIMVMPARSGPHAEIDVSADGRAVVFASGRGHLGMGLARASPTYTTRTVPRSTS